MSRQVYWVGWSRSDAFVPGARSIRVAPEELTKLSISNGTVLVLGDLALEKIVPSALQKLLQGRSAAVILCPDRVSARTVAHWLESEFHDVVIPEALTHHLDKLGVVAQRPIVVNWLQIEVEPDSTAAKAIAIIPRLMRPFSVSEWVNALGWSRAKLRRICLESFGINPSAVLWRYVSAVVAAGREQGMSAEQLAILLGYSETSALSHAFAKRNARSLSP